MMHFLYENSVDIYSVCVCVYTYINPTTKQLSAYKNMSWVSFYTSKPNGEKSRYPESGMCCASSLPMPVYCWSIIRKALPVFINSYRDKIHIAMH